MNWKKIKCAIFGHQWVGKNGFWGPHDCVCGAHRDAIKCPPPPPMPTIMPPRVEPAMAVEITKLDLAPGDTLVIFTQQWLSIETCAHMRAHLEPFVPSGTRILILDGGMTLGKIGAAA